jgi:hypothetical protein
MENLQRRVPFGSCKWGAKGVTETQVGDMLCMYIIYIYILLYYYYIYMCVYVRLGIRIRTLYVLGSYMIG